MVRPRYRLPGLLHPASLTERRRFYASRMDYAAASQWMSRPGGRRVYALILGRHSGIYPRAFRHLKNVPLVIDDVDDVAGLKPYLLRYRPEGVYYDRNVYAWAAEGTSIVPYPNAWRSPSFRGQELAFDLDPENLDCPVHGDIVAKMKRHQGLSFCDWEYVEIRRQAALLFDDLAHRWKKLRIVFSGRGFHIHVFDPAAFRLGRAERSRIAKSVSRRYPIDEWVTSGEMRLIRLPYSLHGMVSRTVLPVPRAKLERFLYDDPRAVPRR